MIPAFLINLCPPGDAGSAALLRAEVRRLQEGPARPPGRGGDPAPQELGQNLLLPLLTFRLLPRSAHSHYIKRGS